jgi:hypothetical protein
VQDARPGRVDVGGEVTDEAVLGQPGEGLLVDFEVGQRRGRRPGPEQRAQRLALVAPWRGRASIAASSRVTSASRPISSTGFAISTAQWTIDSELSSNRLLKPKSEGGR